MASRGHVVRSADLAESFSLAGLKRRPISVWVLISFWLRQFIEKLLVYSVATGVDVAFLHGLLNRTIGLVQMTTVVEFAATHMGLNIWHVAPKCVRVDLVNAKGLETRGVNQSSLSLTVDPIKRGGRGGVFARVESLRDLLGPQVGMRDCGIDEGAFAHT